jgi:predicted permease
MSWIRGVIERVREALDRGRFESELDEEIRFHIDRETERLVATGMSPEAARREAQRMFGEVGRVKDDAREGSGIPWIESVVRDARVAARGLRRAPGFTTSAVLTLGIGIGATTAVFSLIDGVLLEPLPYPSPERLVRIHEKSPPSNVFNISVADLLAIHEMQQVFEAVAGVQGGSAAFTGRGDPQQIPVARVTADWFRVLGVEPAEGRGFLPGEDRPGAEPAVVLSASFRDRAFGDGVDALGQSIVLDDVSHTVVGVLDEGVVSLAGYTADAWPIYRLDPPRRRGPFPMRGVGRLLPDRTFEDAVADLDRISVALFPIYSGIDYRDDSTRLTPFPLKEVMLGDVGQGLWLMLGAVAGVLLIAVANVGSLFLVRATGKEREVVLRASLGATRRRLAAQLFIESLLVASLGGAAGVLLGWLGLEVFIASNPAIPRIREVGLDGSTLLLTAAVTLGAALLFGLAPMARVAMSSMSARGLGDRTGARGAWARLRSALVTAEFALAFSLAVGAALLLVSFQNLQRVDLGYDPDGVVALQMALPTARYGEIEESQAFWEEALERIRAQPGMVSAGLGSSLPPGGAGSTGTNNFDLVDRPVPDGTSEPVALWNEADAGFLSALGVPLLRGRLFEDADRNGDPVIVVSESWAERYYPGGDALGAQLYSGGDRSVALTVVGVVGNVEYQWLTGNDDEAVYEPTWQAPMRAGWVVVRSERSTADVALQLRSVIGSMDPNLPLRIQSMDERSTGPLARPRQWTTLLGVFAGFGLLLACVGVYGVLSHYVSTQRREIGIRVSLGAQPASVRRLVIGRGMSLAVLGILLGLAASLFLARWLQTLVFGVSPHDPLTLAAVAVGLALVAFAACALPAINATRIDPAVTLKGD